MKSVLTLACLHSEVVLLCNRIYFSTINSIELPKCVRHILRKRPAMELEGPGFQALEGALAQLLFSGPPGIHELLVLSVA